VHDAQPEVSATVVRQVVTADAIGGTARVDRQSSDGIAHNGRGDGLRSWVAEVVVEPKPGVNDPQGEAIFGGLRSLGYAGVAGVRSGRFFRVRLRAADAESARMTAAAMCDQLLANPVIETYSISILEDLGDEGVFPIHGVRGGHG
jgi:phosphoribosylformylglycinamidine synthase